MIAEFSKWAPEGLTSPKAIIVLTPPSQSDGRRMVDEKVWREFATAHGCGLVGCYFQDDNPTGIEEYCNMDSGSDLCLCEYVGRGFNHRAPKFLLWGFSAGGQFNYEFSSNHPNLVAGFVVNKGGIYYTHLAPEKTRAIPGLFIVGERDQMWRKRSLEGIWRVNVAAGAGWQWKEEPGVGHSVGNSVQLGQEFFAEILRGMKVTA